MKKWLSELWQSLFPPKLEPGTIVPGNAYPVRLLHMCNSHFIIAYIIDDVDDRLITFAPHEVHYNYDHKQSNVKSYELVPYLSQFANNDILDTENVVPFFKSSIQAVCLPAGHMNKIYQYTINVKQHVANDPEEPIYNPEAYAGDANTLH